MASTLQDKLTRFHQILQEANFLEGAQSLLHWDQQTYMPPAGSEHRAKQMAFLAQLTHERLSSPSFIGLVEDLYAQQDKLNADEQVNVFRMVDQTRRLSKLPSEFVKNTAELHALCFSKWVEARPKNDFRSVQSDLEKIVAAARKKADLIGYDEHPWDALHHSFEPFSKLSKVKPLLLDLAEGLKEIVNLISQRETTKIEVRDSISSITQHAFCSAVAKDLGYSFESGRLDSTTHPFASEMGPKDVRITTRFHKDNFLSSVFTTLHEAGHALYDLGLPREHYASPCGWAISLGIHESQSRFWENFIGRSAPYARYLHKKLKELVPETAAKFSAEDIQKAVNWVEPTLIRVESDEVTYSLHIVIRMLLEEQLIAGDLDVEDLPEAWDGFYQQYLGIKSPDLKDGVLQDVHWFSGSIGYFPTYAMGNLYAAMMHERMQLEIQQFESQVENGSFTAILKWLRERIHRQGMRLNSDDLAKKATGMEVSSKPFLAYLRKKHAVTV